MHEATIRVLLQVTARATFLFFVCAFTSVALRNLQPVPLTQWLARNRGYFLVAVAVSHSVHLAGIFLLGRIIGWSRMRVALIGGGFVYILIYALAIAAVVRLATGRQLPLIGSAMFESFSLYVMWLVFAGGFVPRMVSGWPAYSILGGLAVLALVVRLSGRRAPESVASQAA